jgi:hypothetical protein
VVSVFLSLCTSVNNTELRGSGDKEHRSFICGALMVGINKINEGQYPSKMDDLIIFLEITWGLFMTSHIREGIYGRYQIISLSLHGI